MNLRNVSAVFVLGLMLLAIGCASVPKQEYTKSARKHIHTIAILDVFTPSQYTILNAGGAAGFLGGAVGGAMQAKAEQGRAEQFTAAMQKRNVQLAKALADALETELRKQNYQVIRLSNVQPRSNGTATPDYKHLTDQADAVLDVDIAFAGYMSETFSLDYEPWIRGNVRLASPKTGKSLYFQVVNYGAVLETKNVVDLPAPKPYRYGSFDKLLAQADSAARGLEAGAAVIAKQVAKDLR